MPDHSQKFTASQIAEACAGTLVEGPGEAAAIGISTDSRTLRVGEAFFALIGPNHDAHSFVPEALKAGASVLVVGRTEANWPCNGRNALVVVEDTTQALLKLAAWHRNRLRSKVLTVTGSCGKTTVKDMTAAILRRHGSCSAAPKSFNNRVGVSLSLLGTVTHEDYVVLELGANSSGEIDELARCARPEVGVITCIGECHLEGFGDMRGVRDAKAELVGHVSKEGALVLNADDSLCLSVAGEFGGQVRTFGFSPDADVRPVKLRHQDGGWAFRAAGCEFRLPVAGRHNVLNAAAALSASLCVGAEPKVAAEALADFRLAPLRFAKRVIAGVTLIEDCYNSSPTAVLAAVDAFLDEPIAGRRVVVFGDMLELGPHSPEFHRRMGFYLAGQDIQMLAAVGRFGRHLLEGWNARASSSRHAMHFKDVSKAWLPLWNELRAGDGVLIKGSRALALERMTEHIARHAEEQRKEAAA